MDTQYVTVSLKDYLQNQALGHSRLMLSRNHTLFQGIALGIAGTLLVQKVAEQRRQIRELKKNA